MKKLMYFVDFVYSIVLEGFVFVFMLKKTTIDSNVDLSRKSWVLNTSIRRVLILHLIFTFNLYLVAGAVVPVIVW